MVIPTADSISLKTVINKVSADLPQIRAASRNIELLVSTLGDYLIYRPALQRDHALALLRPNELTNTRPFDP